MPWERVDVDEHYDEVTNPLPEVHRVDVKVEDIHRTDLPGCPRHRTAGAIQQHTSWSDPDGRHNRFTGYLICAECAAFLGYIDPQSAAKAEYDSK